METIRFLHANGSWTLLRCSPIERLAPQHPTLQGIDVHLTWQRETTSDCDGIKNDCRKSFECRFLRHESEVPKRKTRTTLPQQGSYWMTWEQGESRKDPKTNAKVTITTKPLLERGDGILLQMAKYYYKTFVVILKADSYNTAEA